MSQQEIINNLTIHLSSKQLKEYNTSYYRIKNSMFCPYVHKYLKKTSAILTNQLNSLINENEIDLNKLKEMGLFQTVRGNTTCYFPSSNTFEMQIIRNYKIKEKVINNMLFAINLIDSNTLCTTTSATGT